MLILLASGKLIKDPVKRTTRTGRTYCILLLSAPSDDEPVLINAIAFSETAEQLLKLSKDDTVTLLGKAKLRSRERDGKTKTGLSLTVDKALSPYELSKKCEALTELRSQPKVKLTPELAFREDDLPF